MAIALPRGAPLPSAVSVAGQSVRNPACLYGVQNKVRPCCNALSGHFHDRVVPVRIPCPHLLTPRLWEQHFADHLLRSDLEWRYP